MIFFSRNENQLSYQLRFKDKLSFLSDKCVTFSQFVSFEIHYDLHDIFIKISHFCRENKMYN